MPPTAVVLGLPWFPGGSGQVMLSQLRFLREAGWRVVFVAVPWLHDDHAESPMWAHFRGLAPELGADEVVVAGPDRGWSGRRRSLGLLKLFARGGTSLDWAMEPARWAPIPLALRSLMRSRATGLLLANHLFTLPYATRLRALARRKRDLPLVLVTHDVQSDLFHDTERAHPLTGAPDELDALLDAELAALRAADVLIHVSEHDAAFFRRRLDHCPHHAVYPSSQPAPEEDAVPCAALRRAVTFLAGMNPMNVRALRWYDREVRPHLGPAAPELAVAGRLTCFEAPPGPGYEWVGQVADPIAFYRTGRVAAVPMRIGRGISIKTIEAAAAGSAIVGTAKAFRGIPAADLAAVGMPIYDDGPAFARGVLAALADPEPLARASRELHRRLFTWDRFRRAMAHALASVGV